MSHSTEIGTLLNSKFVYKTSSLNSWLNIVKRIKPHGGVFWSQRFMKLTQKLDKANWKSDDEKCCQQ